MDDMMFTSGNATSGGAQQVSEESGLVRYTRRELTLIGEGDDPMQVEMNENVLQMVKIFASQGHSGFSASYLLAVLDRVMRFMPLTPLTGDESEWTDTEDGAGTDQNNRCSAVFRRNNDNSTAYYLYGKEFSDDDGKTWHHTKNSRVPVCFPYSPPYEAEKIMLPNGSLSEE